MKAADGTVNQYSKDNGWCLGVWLMNQKAAEKKRGEKNTGTPLDQEHDDLLDAVLPGWNSIKRVVSMNSLSSSKKKSKINIIIIDIESDCGRKSKKQRGGNQQSRLHWMTFSVRRRRLKKLRPLFYHRQLLQSSSSH